MNDTPRTDAVLAKPFRDADEKADALKELARTLERENARLVEDRARFPDRPDDIGSIISAHIENLHAAAKHYEDCWRRETIRSSVLENRIASVRELLK